MTEGILTQELLDALPEPSIIEPLTYEQIYKEIVETFAAISPEYELLLHSDPSVKLLQVFAFREWLIRGRVNDAAKARLLALATGSDLDHIGVDHGIARLDDEDDATFRSRIRLRASSSSAAGPIAMYRFYALSASPLVRDATVLSPSPGVVRIHVLSTEGDGEADQDTLDAVYAVCNADDVRVLTDQLEVVSASIVPIDITADIWMDTNTQVDVLSVLNETIPAIFDNARTFGRDITASWITTQLQIAGVHHVVLHTPDANVAIEDNECAALGNLTLTSPGRDY